MVCVCVRVENWVAHGILVDLTIKDGEVQADLNMFIYDEAWESFNRSIGIWRCQLYLYMCALCAYYM